MKGDARHPATSPSKADLTVEQLLASILHQLELLTERQDATSRSVQQLTNEVDDLVRDLDVYKKG